MHEKFCVLAVVTALFQAWALGPAHATTRAAGAVATVLRPARTPFGVSGFVFAPRSDGTTGPTKDVDIKFVRVGTSEARTVRSADNGTYNLMLDKGPWYVTATKPGFQAVEPPTKAVTFQSTGGPVRRDIHLMAFGDKIEVFGPPANLRLKGRAPVSIRFRTGCSAPFHYQIVEARQTGKTVMDLGSAEPVYDGAASYHQDWIILPENDLPAGSYRIRVSARSAAMVEDGTSGLSPVFRYERPTETKLSTLEPVCVDRYAFKAETYSVSLPVLTDALGSWPQLKSRPGQARVGLTDYYSTENSMWGEWRYRGYVFRSQVTFPGFAALKPKVKGTVKAWLFIKVKNHVVSGEVTPFYSLPIAAGMLYWPTGPWSGGPLDTPPGLDLQALPPNYTEVNIDVTRTVQSWVDGKPNHGFLLCACDESFSHRNCTHVSFLEIHLNVQHQVDK